MPKCGKCKLCVDICPVQALHGTTWEIGKDRGFIMRLVRAEVNDCDKIWRMQIKAFAELLEKYQDYATSPGNEAKERIETKLLQEFTYFYYIFDDNVYYEKN